ncbi:MAG: pitrilysin family protein [Candidatus Latescibacterota bacterium]
MAAITKKFYGAGGIPVVHANNPNSRVFCVGIWVKTGSRHEMSDEAGLSHFLEHMIFKGTTSRSALEISQEIERVGGSLDAFTTKEHICIHAQVLESHAELAFDILGDMLSNPLFAKDHIELEKQVVLEEIRDVMDSPDDLIHDLFAAVIFSGHPLGQPILGSPATVSRFTRKKLVRFANNAFRSSNMLISVYGNIDRRSLRRLTDKHFHLCDGKVKQNRKKPGRYGPVRKLYRRRLHHQHLCIGTRTWSYLEDRRYPLMILTNLLGGGMSSRLFQLIREELGLAYSVFTYTEFIQDSGLIGTYLSVNPKNAAIAVRCVLEEFQRARNGDIQQNELDDMKEQLRGKILLGLETSAAKMMRLSRNELYFGRQIGEQEILRKIDGVSLADLRDVAYEVLDPNKTSLVSLGPTSAGTRITL